MLRPPILPVRFLALACALVFSQLKLVVADDWLAGSAKVKITPQQPMPMAGYASRGAKHASQTLNELWAKTLVLQDGRGNQGVLITLDLCGIDRKLSQRITGALGDSFGWSPSQIILSVSHTHSGPVVAENLRPMHYMMLDETDQKLVNAYADRLVASVVACAEEAHQSLRPSRLAHSIGTAKFAVNRRNNPEKDVVSLRESGQLAGPVDHDVPVLAVHQGSQLIAVVFGYACHCTTLDSMRWSSDYAGFAQDAIEEKYAGCTAMFWAGCGADQNPLPRRTVQLAQDYGRQLAEAVEQVLAGDMHPLKPRLSTQRQEIDLPFGPLPNQQQLAQDTQSKNKYIAARAKHLLEQVQSGQPLAKTYPYPIACWRFGDSVDLIALGGEVVVDYSLAIKASQPDPNRAVWVMGYAHDVMAYIPSRRVLAEGGYEGGGAMVYYGLPTSWAPDVEQLILDEVTRQRTAGR